MSQTIYAQSTGAGKAAIAIMRVSGPGCLPLLEQACPGIALKDREAKLVYLRTWDGKLLDRALVIKFSAPRSYTGEDMLEFHVTGSRAVLAGLAKWLEGVPGVRPAEAGEFAKRAYENGKLDLIEVEGLSSVLAAETEFQLRHAMQMASGRLSRQCETVRGLLLSVMAYVESLLDFSDIDDTSAYSRGQFLVQLVEIRSQLLAMLEHSGVSERLRDGMVVVIAGAPNVGKSTFLNYLARREVALVSPLPGTTRDSLEVAAEVAGFPVTFVDTAGIRDSADILERQAIARTLERAEQADLILWLFDNSGIPEPLAAGKCPIQKVRTKGDLDGDRVDEIDDVVTISAKSGMGADRLLRIVGEFASRHFKGTESVSFGTERQRAAVRDAIGGLERCLDDPDIPLELAAEELRVTAQAMARITGRIGVEQILTEVFSRLCVGK